MPFLVVPPLQILLLACFVVSIKREESKNKRESVKERVRVKECERV